MRPLPFCLLLGGLLLGCYEQPELSESWQLDRLRVLAVAAEPAEPQPGETVSFTSLVYSPDHAEIPTIWFACLPEAADDYGCDVDTSVFESLSGLDPENMSSEELAQLYADLVAAGFVGAEPYFPPSWTPPADALDGLSDTEKLEGLSAIVSIFATPADAASLDDAEAAYKRVPVSLATTPNQNPVLTGFLQSDGTALADGAQVTVSAGATLTVDVVLSGEPEDYTYTDDDGVVETRTEEPYFTWYAEGGTFEDTTTLWPETQVTWTAPDESGTLLLYCVARDRRGGMAWSGLSVVVP